MNAIERQLLAGHALKCLLQDGYLTEVKTIRQYLRSLRAGIQGHNADNMHYRDTVIQYIGKFVTAYPAPINALKDYIRHLEEDLAFVQMGYSALEFDTKPIAFKH